PGPGPRWPAGQGWSAAAAARGDRAERCEERAEGEGAVRDGRRGAAVGAVGARVITGGALRWGLRVGARGAGVIARRRLVALVVDTERFDGAAGRALLELHFAVHAAEGLCLVGAAVPQVPDV